MMRLSRIAKPRHDPFQNLRQSRVSLCVTLCVTVCHFVCHSHFEGSGEFISNFDKVVDAHFGETSKMFEILR